MGDVKTGSLAYVVRHALRSFRRRYEKLSEDAIELSELRKLHYEVVRTYVEAQRLHIHLQHQILARLRGDHEQDVAMRMRAAALHDDITELHELGNKVRRRIGKLEGRTTLPG